MLDGISGDELARLNALILTLEFEFRPSQSIGDIKGEQVFICLEGIEWESIRHG